MTPPALEPAHAQNKPPQVRLPDLPWHARLNVLNVTLILFLLAVILSSGSMAGSGRSISYVDRLVSFSSRLFPPDLSVLPETLTALGETVKIAVMATFFAILISFPIGAAAARTLSPSWLVFSARMFMNVVRSVPALIWAVLAVAVVGANPLAGVIALTFYSLGYLGKFFSDTFESIDLEVAEGLRAIGANPVQSFQHGVWPHAKPLIWSYSLWMLEYNIRSAAIIGYVGAGGIGFLLYTYQEYSWWHKSCTVIALILILVTFLDFLGEWIRQKITTRLNRPLGEG